MTEAWVLSFTLVLVRLATFWMINPIWSSLKPPRQVKLGLVLALSVFWFSGLEEPAPLLLQNGSGATQWLVLGLMVLREVVLGGILGFSFHLFLIPMQIAGSYIGQEFGLSMATMTDPSTGAVNNIVSTLFQAIAVCVFFLLDLHHYIVYLLEYSFRLIPAGQAWNIEALQLATYEFASLTEQGLLICIPVAIAMFLGLIALLVLARAVPALNLFSIGLSIRLILGLAALMIFLPHVFAIFESQLGEGLSFLERLLYQMASAP